MSFDVTNESLADPKALTHVRVGMVSPLWPIFAGAAVSGAAWWWMTQWARPANLEAVLGAATEVQAEVLPEALAIAEPVVETYERFVETAAEPVIDAVAATEPVVEAAADVVPELVIEATPEPVLEMVADAKETFEPIGGEAAPIAPIVAAMTPEVSEVVEAAKPKKKSAAPKLD